MCGRNGCIQHHSILNISESRLKARFVQCQDQNGLQTDLEQRMWRRTYDMRANSALKPQTFTQDCKLHLITPVQRVQQDPRRK